jgi:hypothetical protein
MDEKKKKKKDGGKKDRHLPYRLVRIPEALYLELQQVAEDTDRPVSREVRRAIEAHIRTHRERHAQE